MQKLEKQRSNFFTLRKRNHLETSLPMGKKPFIFLPKFFVLPTFFKIVLPSVKWYFADNKIKLL